MATKAKYRNFDKLIAEVNQVDSDAARALRKIKFSSITYKAEIDLTDRANLDCAFFWHKTSQDALYWAAIHIKLQEHRQNASSSGQ